jgi:seryl-tRNA synthetase
MPEPITILGLAKTTSDIIKAALDFAKKAKNTELAEKLIDLYQNFIQLSETNQELRSEIQELKGEIAELKKRPDIAAKLRPESSSGSYYLKEDDGEESGPFCSVCWDVDGRLVRQSMIGLQTICQYCVTAR